MVEMPVGEGERVGLLNRDVQRAGVLFQHSSLSRIKQQSSALPFHSGGEAVFGEQTRAEDGVFYERGDATTHGFSKAEARPINRPCLATCV